MTITPAELLAVPDTPEDTEACLPIDELRVLARVVTDELGGAQTADDLDETVALRQAQWMAAHALQGWISGWAPRCRALAIELVEENLSPSARRRVLLELADLKREVDERDNPALQDLFAQRTLTLATYFTRRRLFR